MNTRQNKKLVLTFITLLLSAPQLIGMERNINRIFSSIKRHARFWRSSPKDRPKPDILIAPGKTACYEIILPDDGYCVWKITADESYNYSFVDHLDHNDTLQELMLIFTPESDLSILPRLLSILQKHPTIHSFTIQGHKYADPLSLPELNECLYDLLEHNEKLEYFELGHIKDVDIEALLMTAKKRRFLKRFVFEEKLIYEAEDTLTNAQENNF